MGWNLARIISAAQIIRTRPIGVSLLRWMIAVNLRRHHDQKARSLGAGRDSSSVRGHLRSVQLRADIAVSRGGTKQWNHLCERKPNWGSGRGTARGADAGADFTQSFGDTAGHHDRDVRI